MARLSGLEKVQTDDSLVMNSHTAEDLNATYDFLKIGFEVNDGKYLTYINDREEE